MASITLKQGDTTPEFTATLENPAQELTGDETIRFYVEAPTDQNQQQGDLIVNAEIPDSQVDYTSNEVTYDFSAGETSRLDDHHAEFVVTYPDGEIQTFPESDYHTITVEEPVNRDMPVADLDPQDITVGVVDADQVNAPTLQAVETLTGSLTGGQTLSDIAGPNLSIQNGELTAGDVQESANHYNTTYDSDEDGTIDADVDNDSVHSRELSVNDQPSPVTGLWGTSGEMVQLYSTSETYGSSISATSYDFFTANSGTPRIDTEQLLSYTNIETVYLSFQINLSNDSGDASYARFHDTPESEVTTTSGGNNDLKSPRVPNDTVAQSLSSPVGRMPLIETKVDGGTGEVGTITWSIWGEIA